MFMLGMQVRLRKRRVIMIVTGVTSDKSQVHCSWYESGKLKQQAFRTEELIVIEAGYNHLSFT